VGSGFLRNRGRAGMYRAIDVWKRRSGTEVIRYRCFEVLSDGKFCVQSADFFQLPLINQKFDRLDRQFVELLIEEDPDVRSPAYPSLEEAIRMHDAEFESP
jgi:hypothetical protein